MQLKLILSLIALAALCMPAFGQTTATGQTVNASQINATSITRNLTKINESDPVYWYNKGEELLNASKYNDAIKADDEAIRLASNSAEDWYNKCEALYNQSKYNESIAACDESSRKASILAMTWNNKGVALKKQGKYVDAIQAYDEAIRFDPGFVNAWRDKARILVEQGKYEDALQAFDEALQIDPRVAEIWYDKSNLLVHLGRTSEAKNAYLIAKGDGWDVLPFVESPAGKHSCQIGTPDISEFSINWTDNKNYTKITKNVFDDSSVSLGLESWKATGYSLYAIENATDSTAALEFSIEWNPEEKYPSDWRRSDTKPDEGVSVTDITIQGKKATLSKFKDHKSYQGPDTPPETIPAYFVVSYYPDEHTTLTIRAPASEWKDSEFKEAMSSLKITPPAGYY